MRSLFIVLLLANVALLALDRGWLGQSLALRGREPERIDREVRPDTIQIPRLPGVNADPIAPLVPSSPQETPAPRQDEAPAEPAQTEDAKQDDPAPIHTDTDAPVPANPADTSTSQMEKALPPVDSKPVPLACLEWGTFNSQELDRARQWSAEHLPAAKLSTRGEPPKAPWMVIVPPQASASAAQAMAAQFAKNGVQDFFVVQEGPYQHGISLGVFRTEEGAKRHASTLQAKGIRTAKVVARPNSVHRNWVRLQGVDQTGRDAIAQAQTLFAQSTLRECELPAVAAKGR